jgi:hypothetical protein
VTEKHVRALREAARKTRGRLAAHTPRGRESVGVAAHRRADLDRAARSAAARLAAVEARLRRGPAEAS